MAGWHTLPPRECFYVTGRVNIDITKSSGAHDKFVISGHVEACGGYIMNLGVVRYIVNFIIPEFIILKSDCIWSGDSAEAEYLPRMQENQG